MPGIGIGISPMFSRGGGLPTDLILWLDANEGKTLVGAKVSQWDDQTSNGNDAVQGTDANRPTDATAYLTFDGGDFMTIPDNSSVDLKSRISLYSRVLTSATTNFMGFIDKYDGGTTPETGYSFFLNSAKRPSISASMSKSLAGTTATTIVNDGVEHEVLATINCSRNFSNKRFVSDGEEPEVIKVGSDYYMFYNRYTVAQTDIYYKKSSTPDFSASDENLVLNNFQYCSIYQDGATFRLVVTDLNTENFILYTSSDIEGTFSAQGTILTFGGVNDSYAIADPHELKIGSTYYLYYSGFTAASVAKVCYATSATGLAGSYTKQGVSINVGGVGEFDLTLTADPDVNVLPGGDYIMFYTGYNATLAKQQQGYATSSDGVTWTKFANNPIFYFTGETFEAGIYGPNEPCALLDNGIWYFWYRSDNTLDVDFKIARTQFNSDVNGLPICGSETVTSKIYVDGVLENTAELTGALGIDYILPNSHDVFIGGDNVSTLYFTGDIYEAKIWNSIQTP